MKMWKVAIHFMVMGIWLVGPITVAPAQEAREILLRSCIRCHSEERLKTQRFTLSGWNDMVERMRAYGAIISREEQRTLASYLVGLYGPRRVQVPTTVYVTAEDTNEVWVIDPRERKVTGKIEVGRNPHGIASGPQGRYVYVTNMV